MSSKRDAAEESNELASLLTASATLDADLYSLLEDAWNDSSQRHIVCLAFCKAAIEHAASQRVLIGDGLHGTALSLIRLHFESVVRAAWVLYGAKDEWLAKFCAPVPIGDLSEPQMGPPLPVMLGAIESVAPQAALELRRLCDTVKVMHSFVHGGVHLVVHALRGYPPEKLVAVLKNRNMLLIILSNVLVAASQKPGLRGAVRVLMDQHVGCMPPVRAGEPR